MCTECERGDSTALRTPLSHTDPGGVNLILGAHSSEADVDERSLPDLGDPLLESGVVLFPVQDVANLAAGLCQRLTRERLLRVEMEQVIAHGRPCRRRRLAGLQAEDGLLDL